jgi:hypothetical protein
MPHETKENLFFDIFSPPYFYLACAVLYNNIDMQFFQLKNKKSKKGAIKKGARQEFFTRIFHLKA